MATHPVTRNIVIIVGGAAVIYLANMAGWWLVTPAVGLVTGLLLRRGQAVAYGAVTGAAGWGGGLVIASLHGGVGRIAQVVGGLTGLGTNAGTEVIAITVLYGALLCLAGGWLGVAAASLRRLVPAREPTVAESGSPAAADPAIRRMVSTEKGAQNA